MQSIKRNVMKLGPALTFTLSFIFKTFRGCDKIEGEQVAVLIQQVIDMSHKGGVLNRKDAVLSEQVAILYVRKLLL